MFIHIDLYGKVILVKPRDFGVYVNSSVIKGENMRDYFVV